MEDGRTDELFIGTLEHAFACHRTQAEKHPNHTTSMNPDPADRTDAFNGQVSPTSTDDKADVDCRDKTRVMMMKMMTPMTKTMTTIRTSRTRTRTTTMMVMIVTVMTSDDPAGDGYLDEQQ